MIAYSVVVVALVLNSIQLVTSVCNWSLFGIYPLPQGTCSNVGSNSAYATCIEGYGWVYEYDSDDCTGDLINLTMSNSYSCGNAGECDAILFDLGLYSGDECAGSELNEGTIYLAELTDECVYFSQSIYSSITTNASGIFAGLSFSETCDSIVLPLYFKNDTCITGSGNSTLYLFEEIILAGQTTTETAQMDTETTDDTSSESTQSQTEYETTDASADTSDDCNYVLWFPSLYPLVDGECNYLDTNAVGSIMAECASNGESATIIEYKSTDCSGNEINTTDATHFYCDANGNDCDPIILSLSYYIDSDECSDGSDKSAELILAPLDNECLSFTSTTVSLSVSTDGIFASVYGGSDCDEPLYGTTNVTDGECQLHRGNSTKFEFSQDGTGGSSSSSSSSSNNSTSDTDNGSSDDDDSAIGYTKEYFIFSLCFSFVISVFLQ